MAESVKKTLSASILEFVNIVDKDRNQEFIAGQNSNLTTYKSWYKGANAWHCKKQIKGNNVETVTLEASGTPKLIAEDWASNYANENTVITIATPEQEKTSTKEDTKPNENTPNKIVNNILKKEGFFAKFNSFAEKFNAYGCGATVVIPDNFKFDPETNKLIKDDKRKIKIKFLEADRVVPITIEDGEVTECAFIRVTTRETILQIHIIVEGGYVIAEVKGKNSGQGSIPEQFDYNSATIIKTNSMTPLFQVWHPNIEGVDAFESIYSQAIGWFKLTDTIFDTWFKEFERGKKKRFIASELEQIDSNGEVVATADLLDDEDVQIPLGTNKDTLISEFNAQLRVDPILKAMVGAMNMAARLCGLGDTTFEIGDAGGRPIQTATAAIIKESKLYKNIIKQENFATDRIKKMLLAIKEVYNSYISDKQLEFEEDDIQVVYDDNIMEDTDTKKKNQLQEVQSGIMSIAEYRSNWYDEDYEAAVQFVQSHAMLLDKFILPLQSHVITPEIFVDLVFGDKFEKRQELINYINEYYGKPKEQEEESGFEDETEEEPKEEKQEETEDDVDEE